MNQAAGVLKASGKVSFPAASWIAAAEVAMKTAMGGGRSLPDTPEAFLEPMLAHRGWVWRWEGADLVLELPGWTQPAPIIVAIQDGLFDLTPTS